MKEPKPESKPLTEDCALAADSQTKTRTDQLSGGRKKQLFWLAGWQSTTLEWQD